MRTNINFAMNFHKHYPNHNKNMWAESLTRGDLIMLNDRAVVYISHETKWLPNGMGGERKTTHYTVIDGKHTILASDHLNNIEPLNK